MELRKEEIHSQKQPDIQKHQHLIKWVIVQQSFEVSQG